MANVNVNEKEVSELKVKATELKKKAQDFYQNNYNIVRSAGILLLLFGCWISLRFTINFFVANSYTKEGKEMATQMAIFTELSTYITWAVGFGVRHIKKFKIFSNVCIGASVILFILSIMASGGAMYQEKTEKEKNAYTQSEEYKTQKSEYNRKLSEYNTSSKSFTDAQNYYNTLLNGKNEKYKEIENTYKDSEYKKSIAYYKSKAWYKNGIDPLNAKVDKKIAKDKADYDKSILEAKADMDSKSEKKDSADTEASKSKPKSGSAKSKDETNMSGYSGFYCSLVGDLGKTIDAYTYLILSIMLGVLIHILIYWLFIVIKVQYGIKPKFRNISNDMITATATNEIWEPESKGLINSLTDKFKKPISEKSNVKDPDLDPMIKKNKIGFKIDNSKVSKIGDIDCNDIVKCLDIIYSEEKIRDGERRSPSLDKIKELSGLKLKSVKNVMGFLELKGVVEAIDEPGKKRTVIHKNREVLGI